jgi:hypothetical protein
MIGIVLRRTSVLIFAKTSRPSIFGMVEIKHYEIGSRGIRMRRSAPQKCHGVHTVVCHVQLDRRVRVAKGFLDQPHVAPAVFDQEKLYDPVGI